MAVQAGLHRHAPQASFIDRLNTDWHEIGLQTFMFIVLAHWMEHLVQGFQIYVLGWAPPAARGVLGLFYPWLIKSEALHYGYALVMLIGLFLLRKGFTEPNEHFLLQMQAITGHNLFGRPVPTSLVQLWVPRVELHLFYNTIVFIPMVIAMYYHMFPSASAAKPQCTCAWNRDTAAA
jgi:hypothetical protein